MIPPATPTLAGDPRRLPPGPLTGNLVLFTRYPQPGQAKSRLVPLLGPDAAAKLQRRLTEHVVARIAPWLARPGNRCEIRFDGGNLHQMRAWLGESFSYRPQGEGDLGARMERTVTDHFAAGAASLLIIGADCPELDAATLDHASSALARSPAVFGPAEDGGYYLVGLRQPVPDLFRNIPWGTDAVLRTSLRKVRRHGLNAALLPCLRDIDRPDDLSLWARASAPGRTLSVIIPTLNEEREIPTTLARVLAASPQEVIVADGGSTDDTRALSRSFGVKVLAAPPGRSHQLNAAAATARGDNLLLLHADTWPPPDFPRLIAHCLDKPNVAAGAFSFSLREPFTGRALVETLVSLRCRLLHSPFGDQGLFLRRELFETLGGLPPWPLLEDVEMVRRLRLCGRVHVLPERGITSGRRWQSLGVWRTLLINQIIMIGFFCRVSPNRLARFYGAPARPHEALPQ